jgi:two-component system cell cycle sensor histidine kinase/response regulator CckA
MRILHLEDDARDAAMVRNRLQGEGLACDIVLVDDRNSFESALAGPPFDLIISDYSLPLYDGVTALKHALAAQPDVPVIMVSGTVGDEEAVRCLHMGATDYLLKARLDRLGSAVRRAIQEAETRRGRRCSEQALRLREQTLRENDERTSFALAAARTGVWEVELSTGRLTWSDSMAPLFGLTPDHAPATARDFLALIHPDDRGAAQAAVQSGIASRRDCLMELRTLWPDGTTHWVEGHAKASYDADGRPLRLRGIGMDIDDRKSLEDQLRQAQKLEAIGQLAGGIAHDFNNVLTVILGFSDILIDGQPPDSPVRADLLEIKKAGARAAGLTRQLLAFSRKQILQPRILDVNVLIDGIKPMLRQLIVASVDLSMSLKARSPLIKMDPTQLEQILVNLAVNAADAMSHGGRLTIETSNIHLDERDHQGSLPLGPGDYVMLSVRDTGVGMDQETTRRMFDPFFTTKDLGKGTGLGLATVYGIVKQSGGDIRVDSTPGSGTTITIHLPQVLNEPASALEPSTDAGRASRGAETILLVEDDEGVRMLSRVTLERNGYRVLQAGNPKEAAQLASEFAGPIDLLLSDVIMPESDGPPLYDRLVGQRPDVRLLYMSGYTSDAIRHVLQVDSKAFLQKPFTPLALANKVREVLDAT